MIGAGTRRRGALARKRRGKNVVLPCAEDLVLATGLSFVRELSRDGDLVLGEAMTSTGEQVLLRLVTGPSSVNPRVLDAFERAVRTLPALHGSPRLVTAGITPSGLPFACTARVKHTTLLSHRRQGGALHPAEVVAVADLALEHIEAFQAVGLWHGHLRPEHLWVLDDGNVIVDGLGWGELRELAGRSDAQGRIHPAPRSPTESRHSQDYHALLMCLETFTTECLQRGSFSPSSELPEPLSGVLRRSLRAASSDDARILQTLRDSIRKSYETMGYRPQDARTILRRIGGCSRSNAASETWDSSREGVSPIAASVSLTLASFGAATATPTPLTVPRWIGERYSLERRLGGGGMGEVYLAKDNTLDRVVALKFLRDTDDAADAGTVARLLAEAKAVAAIQHPNVVSVYDVGTFGGTPFLTMEYVNGSTLRDLLRDGPLSSEACVRLLSEMADALSAAHTRGIIHRDIKPENVMRTRDGSIKLLDFGIAHVVATATGKLGSSRSRSVLGTPLYMAPEQLLGAPSDARCDQWSWAAVGFELATGEPWRRIAQPRSPASVKSLVRDPALASILERALSDAPGARYQDFDEIRDLLRRRPRSRTLPRRALVAMLAVAAAAPVISSTWARRGAQPRLTKSEAIDHDSTSALADAIVGARVPSGTSRDAVLAFKRGVQCELDGSRPEAQAWYKKAAAADPGFAAAQLRVVASATTIEAPEHTAYAAAHAHRTALSHEDVELLTAFEPKTRTPPDHAEFVTRIRSLASRHQKDVELVHRAAWAVVRTEPTSDSIEYAERILANVPELPWRHAILGYGHKIVGDPDRARAEFGRCLDLVASSLSCSSQLAEVYSAAGECSQAQALLRNQTAQHPDDALSWINLGRIAFLADHDEVAAQAGFRHGYDHAPPERLAVWKADVEVRLAAGLGDFSRLSKALGAYELASERDEYVEDRVWLATMRGHMLREQGDARGLLELASKVSRVSHALLTRKPLSDTIRLYALAHAAVPEDSGILEAYRESREALLAAAPARRNELLLWLNAYAHGAATREDALEALARAPRSLPKFTFEIHVAEALGRVLALAGRTAEAEPYLRAAADNCYYLVAPFEAQRARALLASIAFERGDAPTACRYASLLLRAWPTTQGASPENARRILARAGCASKTLASSTNR